MRVIRGTRRTSRLTGELANHLLENLSQVVADKSTPPEEIYQAGDQGLRGDDGKQGLVRALLHRIEPALFANWPDEAVSWLLKGQAEIDRAWLARAAMVTPTPSVTSNGRPSPTTMPPPKKRWLQSLASGSQR